MLGSWLSSVVHAVAAPVGIAAGLVTGNPAIGAAVYSATAKKPSKGGDAAPVLPPVSTSAVNPTGELILGGAAILGLVLLMRHKPDAKK